MLLVGVDGVLLQYAWTAGTVAKAHDGTVDIEEGFAFLFF